MRKTLFWFGWISVSVASIFCLYLEPEKIWLDWSLIGIALLATFFLYRSPNFPHRSRGLSISWVGPALVVLGRVIYLFLMQPNVWENPLTGIDAQIEAGQRGMYLLITFLFLRGILSGTIAFWFFHGYGMIAFAAMISRIWPGRMHVGSIRTESFAGLVREGVQRQPFPLWRWMVFWCTFPAWAQALYLCWILRSFQELV